VEAAAKEEAAKDKASSSGRELPALPRIKKSESKSKKPESKSKKPEAKSKKSESKSKKSESTSKNTKDKAKEKGKAKVKDTKRKHSGGSESTESKPKRVKATTSGARKGWADKLKLTNEGLQNTIITERKIFQVIPPSILYFHNYNPPPHHTYFHTTYAYPLPLHHRMLRRR
jgi:hypothetical protein